MKPEWRTNSKKPIDLSEEETGEFESYSQWLYSRKIASKDFANSNEAHEHLARLYVLGETLADETFQDAVLATMIDTAKSTGCPSDRAIGIIYSGTSSAKSPARKLMIDMFVHAGCKDWVNPESLTKATCVEFVDNLVRGFLVSRNAPPTGEQCPWVKTPEAYSFAAMRAEQNKEAEAEKITDDSMDTSA